MNEENYKGILDILGYMASSSTMNFGEVERSFKAQQKINKITGRSFVMFGIHGLLTGMLLWNLESRMSKLEKILAEQNQKKGENEM